MKSQEAIQEQFKRGVSREKEVKMKCPLFTANKMTDTGGWEETPRDCLKEECAWWNEDFGVCSVKELGRRLWSVANILDEMREVIHCDVKARK